MQTSDVGKKLIKSFEELRLTAYRDLVGVLTIGWGHTGPDVFDNMTITEEDAENLLEHDLYRAEKAIQDKVFVTLNQNQYDALVSFIFNVGVGNFESSTLLKLLDTNDFIGAANQFLRWDHAGGKEIAGLLRRRQAERQLFLEVPNVTGTT
jgi:lysozyme